MNAADTTPLARWTRFAHERFALPALLPLSLIQAASAQYVVAEELDRGGLLVAAFGITALLSLLRLMDEVKDVDRDRRVHPERPLARGLVSVPAARSGVRWGILLLLAAAAVLAVTGNGPAAACYAISVVFAGLMYREFFASAYLEARPVRYALTHQVIVLPIYGFATAAAYPGLVATAPVLWFGLTGLGASFSYEVARKLDPAAHPVLRTYRAVHGPSGAFGLIAVALTVLVISAWRLGTLPWVGPFTLAMVAVLTWVGVRPARHRWAEGMAGILALAQVSAPLLAHVSGAVR